LCLIDLNLVNLFKFINSSGTPNSISVVKLSTGGHRPRTVYEHRCEVFRIQHSRTRRRIRSTTNSSLSVDLLTLMAGSGPGQNGWQRPQRQAAAPYLPFGPTPKYRPMGALGESAKQWAANSNKVNPILGNRGPVNPACAAAPHYSIPSL
jgi:hypothetical protein